MNTTDETYTKATALMTIWTLESEAAGHKPGSLDWMTYLQDQNDKLEDEDIDTCIFIGTVLLRYTCQNGL